MSFYINEDSTGKPLPTFKKAAALLADGATQADGKQFEPNLICVADRFTHDAAIYLYDQREYDRICAGNKATGDEQYVVWLTHPNAKKIAKFQSKQ